MGINNDYSVLKELNNYKNYDVVIRKMINNEIDRQYSIVKWNLVIQSFLFGALSQMKNNDYLIAIIAYGLLASFISFASYLASETKIRRILYFGMVTEDLRVYHFMCFRQFGQVRMKTQITTKR